MASFTVCNRCFVADWSLANIFCVVLNINHASKSLEVLGDSPSVFLCMANTNCFNTAFPAD